MARIHGSKELWLGEMRTDGPEFRAAAAEADLRADVPSCPGWTVADLIHHLGSVYRWANALSVRGVTTPPDQPFKTFFDETHAADLLGWWDGQFAATLNTLDVLDPEMPAWNWAPQAKRAGFWHRRLAHETTVHRWDVQMAVGRAEPIEPRLAADGVAEALDSWLPAGRRRSQGELTGLVALVGTDVEYTWLVRLRGEGIALLDTDTIFDDDEHRPTVIAQGTASDLMLALWGRVNFDVLEVSGDEEALESLRVGP